jgi:AcrR family transcriptional regulator
MPTPSRTSLEEIVAAARAIVDAESLDALTMDRVAATVGVRAPSLYKRVRDRGSLVHLVANDVALDLGTRVIDASATGDPRMQVRAMIAAFRAFAHAHPASYGLLFQPLPESWRADPVLAERAVQPLMRAVASLAGDGQTLEAARTIVAWTRGFIDMELAGSFTLGGDVEAAYDYGVERLIDAIAGTAREP